MKAQTHTLIVAMVGQKLAIDWWDRPNRAFNMKTPNEVWIKDRDFVYDYVVAHIDGQW
jgi:hypothetical protein